MLLYIQNGACLRNNLQLPTYLFCVFAEWFTCWP